MNQLDIFYPQFMVGPASNRPTQGENKPAGVTQPPKRTSDDIEAEQPHGGLSNNQFAWIVSGALMVGDTGMLLGAIIAWILPGTRDSIPDGWLWPMLIGAIIGLILGAMAGYWFGGRLDRLELESVPKGQ